MSGCRLTGRGGCKEMGKFYPRSCWTPPKCAKLILICCFELQLWYLQNKSNNFILLYCAWITKFKSISHYAKMPLKQDRYRVFCFFLPVNPSAFGILVVIVLKILTSTRNTVTRRVILPGTISGGTMVRILWKINSLNYLRFSPTRGTDTKIRGAQNWEIVNM